MRVPPSQSARCHQETNSGSSRPTAPHPSDSSKDTTAKSDDFCFYFVNDRNKLDKIALEAILTQADKINADFYRIMTDQSVLENDSEVYKDTHHLVAPKGAQKKFEKFIEKLLKSAQAENQSRPQFCEPLHQDAFEVSSPGSDWKSFSGK